MASKQIIYSKQALVDLYSVERFLLQHSESAATSVVRSIQRTISNLELQPHMGTVLKSHSCNVLVEPRYKYVIIYQIDGDHIHIRSIFHSRQQRPM